MILNGWARKGLKQGDLTALSELSNGLRSDPNPARVERLSHRGFLARRADKQLRVTVRGRAALLVSGHIRSVLT
jgi:hypothetical protein